MMTPETVLQARQEAAQALAECLAVDDPRLKRRRLRALHRAGVPARELKGALGVSNARLYQLLLGR